MGRMRPVGWMAAGMAALASAAGAGEKAMPWKPEFRHSRIAVTPGGWHATTRGTIRLVFPHQGRWLVFRGGPDSYHFSDDGLKWTATEAPQASRSHLIQGDTIHTFYTVLIEPAPKWIFDNFVCKGTITGRRIRWGKPRKLKTNVSYYPDIKQDAKGHFTMTGRHAIFNDSRQVVATEVLWKRSQRPGEFLEWAPDVRCIRHTGDSSVGRKWTQLGSTVHENLALEDGKSCVFGMMTVGGVGKLYANLFDGKQWGAEDMELATGMSTWAGTDRRMCAVFDERSKVIHLGYVDGSGWLWYRRARSPYGAKDWSKPVRLHDFRTFTVVLSLDRSRRPARVHLLFGRTLFQNGRDLRNTYGSLHLQRLEGRRWSRPVPVSQPGTVDNWYPNMNEDLARGIGVLYLRGSSQTRKGEKPPLDIMFASTGPPKTAGRQEPGAGNR